MRHPVYTRTQSLWVVWVLAPTPLAGTAATLLARDDAAAQAGLVLLALATALLLLALTSFTVEVGEGQIEWRYGWLGWPRWRLGLGEIASVEVTTASFWEGWGIRKTRTGMLYSADGERALRLNLHDGRTLRLGSDEPERLAAFIRPRLPPRRAPGRAR